MQKDIENFTIDYHKFTTIDTPQSERRRLNVGDIWINEAKCKKCGDVIVSNNRHDFKRCKCGAIAVDGGSWYAKRMASREEDIENNIVCYKDIKKED